MGGGILGPASFPGLEKLSMTVLLDGVKFVLRDTQHMNGFVSKLTFTGEIAAVS
jgi:hypothetical protein